MQVLFDIILLFQSAYATLPSKAATDRNYQLPSASVYQISEPDGLRRSMPTGKTRQNVSQYDQFDGIALKRSSVYRKDEFVPVPSKLDHYNINDIVVYRGQMVQMVPLSPNNYTGSGIRYLCLLIELQYIEYSDQM